MKKTVFLVIILSIIMGFAIFFIDKLINKKDLGLIKPSISFSNLAKPTSTPSPTPKPPLLPITESSNLEYELNRLSPPDYQTEFNKLKSDVNGD